MKPALVIDVETREDSRLLDDVDYLESIQKDLTHGSIKDPFKLAEWKGNKFEDHVNGMALHATTGRIVVIGMAAIDKPEEVRVISRMDDEAFLLADFIMLGLDEWFPGQRVICGHNVRKFDIPYLSARCAINCIDLPDWWPFIRDWKNVADTMDVLGADGKLGEWCRAFGIPGPTVTGKEVTRLSEERLREHCAEDVRATATILNRIQRRYPCLRKPKKLSTMRL